MKDTRRVNMLVGIAQGIVMFFVVAVLIRPYGDGYMPFVKKSVFWLLPLCIAFGMLIMLDADDPKEKWKDDHYEPKPKGKLKAIAWIAIALTLSVGCVDKSKKRFPLLCAKQANEYTIMGDSMAACASINGYSDCWNGLGDTENMGASGAPIETVSAMVPMERLKTVVLFCGFNNIKHNDQSEKQIIDKYAILYESINAENIICVGVPPMNHEISNTWYPEGADIKNSKIKAVNDGIVEICGQNNFIDTFATDEKGEALSANTIDGLHPSSLLYGEIIKKIHGGAK